MAENKQYVSRFDEDFDLKDFIADGGYGVVLHVKHRTDEQDYAIKRIRLMSRRKSELARRESKVMAKLCHESIVRYHTSWFEKPPVGWQDDRDKKLFPNHTLSNSSPYSQSEEEPYEEGNVEYMYIKMELCQNTLSDWIMNPSASDNPHRDKEALGIFKQVVGAVDYLHNKDLIHRDIKPSNILFCNKKVKLGDFGLATICEPPVSTQHTCDVEHTCNVGTYFYMSPEQRDGRKYSRKVDIYSLGLVMVELFYGFRTDSERYAVMPNFRELKIPAAFEQRRPHQCTLARRLLCYEPERRHDTQDILQDVLLTGQVPLESLNYPIPANREGKVPGEVVTPSVPIEETPFGHQHIAMEPGKEPDFNAMDVSGISIYERRSLGK